MQTLIQSFQTSIITGIEKVRFGVGWKARAARGTVWLGTGSAAENASRFLRNIVLTRILAPEAFGLMFIVSAFTGAVDAFTQIGIREAVVQNPQGDQKPYLNGAWWLSFIRGLMLYGVAMALAPIAARFYGKPEIIPMLAVALLSIVFSSSISPMAYVAVKKMHYSRWVLIYHGGAIVGIATTVILGLLWRNTWSLVVGFAAEAIARCIISFILCPFLPGLSFQKEHLLALLKYVKGVFGLGILAFLYVQADIFVVGKLRTLQEVAMYGLAYNLVYFPNFFCDAVISPILLPTFASMQGDKERLASGLLRASAVISLMFFPLFALMACVSSWLLHTAYGPVYAGAAIPFVILCASSAIRIVGGILVNLYFATGRPEMNRQASFIRMVVMLSLIIPLVYKYGLVGAALAGLLSSLIWQTYNVFRLRNLIHLPIGRYIASLSNGVCVSLTIVAAWYIIRLLQ